MAATSTANAEGTEVRAEGVDKQVPFPRYLLALVQDESEMLLQPAYDLFAFLDDPTDERWDVELYTERTFEALLHSDRQFDAIVIGLNAAWKSEAVRAALSKRMPRAGLCILHQLEPGSLDFLTDDLGLDITRFPSLVDRVAPVETVAPEDEIVLNWPDPVGLSTDGAIPLASAYCGLARAPKSDWRTVLEVKTEGRRTPVLVRTRTGRTPPVVVATVLLEPRHEGHANLLGNMLAWCVTGRPDAVIVADPESGDEAQLVHRKLRMQGIKAVAGPSATAKELDFGVWPLRGVGDVIVPAASDPTALSASPREDPANARRWLRHGGRLITLGPGERVTVTHGESDAHWVTRRWASWFRAQPPTTLHGGGGENGDVIATRAVLRFIAAVQAEGRELPRQSGCAAVAGVLRSLSAHDSGIEPEAFGLKPPVYYLDPVKELLARRAEAAEGGRPWPGAGGRPRSVDESISTTAAALDLDELLEGRLLDKATSQAFTSWLVDERFPTAAAEYQLEIARCTGRKDLLDRALETLGHEIRTAPVTAALETKVREAVVACEAGPHELDLSFLAGESNVERGLMRSPLLCAHYLIAIGDLRVTWENADGIAAERLLTPHPRVVDRAVIAVGRQGAMFGESDGDRPAHELVSATALALCAYFGRDETPTHVIRPDGQTVPSQLVGSVLKESERLRDENARIVEQDQTIGWASNALGVAGLAILALLVVVAWLLFAGVDDFDLVYKITVTLAVVAGLSEGAKNLLGRHSLAPRWAPSIVTLLNVRKWGDRMRGDDGDDPPSGRP